MRERQRKRQRDRHRTRSPSPYSPALHSTTKSTFSAGRLTVRVSSPLCFLEAQVWLHWIILVQLQCVRGWTFLRVPTCRPLCCHRPSSCTKWGLHSTIPQTSRSPHHLRSEPPGKQSLHKGNTQLIAHYDPFPKLNTYIHLKKKKKSNLVSKAWLNSSLSSGKIEHF